MKARVDYDCAVIGGGPGGLTAALYLGRYKRTVCVIEHGSPRASRVPKIHNLAGEPDGLSGKELLRRLRRQVKRLVVDFLPGEARVERAGKIFRVRVNGKVIRASKVILATGIEDVEPEVPNTRELCEEGVLGYCPICDGYDHAAEKVAVLIRDQHGLDKIPFIAKFSPNLQAVLLDPDLSIPPKAMAALRRLRVELHRGRLSSMEAAPLKRLGPQGSKRELLIHLEGRRPFRVRLAYVALGARVRDEAFRGMRGLRRTKEGYLLVSYHQETSVPGLFAVGDCVNALAQVNVAAGQAAVAATRVHAELGI